MSVGFTCPSRALVRLSPQQPRWRTKSKTRAVAQPVPPSWVRLLVFPPTIGRGPDPSVSVRNQMASGVGPQAFSMDERLNSFLPPPRLFIASAVQRVMVGGTKWHRIFVADFEPQSTILGKAKVVRLRRPPAAHETRARGHKPKVVAIAVALRCCDRQT